MVMPSNPSTIRTGRKVPDIVNAVIEIPKGSKNKYELDEKTGLFKLDRVLNSPFHYATEYGIIPRTWGEDDDPLDVLVLIDQPTFPGCLIEVRPIGVLPVIDNGVCVGLITIDSILNNMDAKKVEKAMTEIIPTIISEDIVITRQIRALIHDSSCVLVSERN